MKASLTTQAPNAEPWMVETHVPVGPSRVETHVVVPFLLSLISMALIALDILLWNWRPIAGVVGAAGLLVFFWRILLGDRLNWKLETITGHDLNGDGAVGRPGPPTLINPDQARRTAVSQVTPPSDVPRMSKFVTRCVYEGTSEGAQQIHPNTAERTNYVECRDALIALGLARWRNDLNHSAGWDLVLDIEQTLATIEKHVR